MINFRAAPRTPVRSFLVLVFSIGLAGCEINGSITQLGSSTSIANSDHSGAPTPAPTPESSPVPTPIPTPATPSPPQLALLAGTGLFNGFKDSQGTSAKFNSPKGMVAVSGFLYVADSNNHAIRKINLTTAEVTTFAGNGIMGRVDAVGAEARFNYPHGVASDGSNLYVADTTNHSIRKINLNTGAVSTIAGSTSGASGMTDATGGSARFNRPMGITFDGTDLIVEDVGNHRYRRVSISSGAVSTLAGPAGFNMNYGSGGLASDGTFLYGKIQAGSLYKITLADGSSSVMTTATASLQDCQVPPCSSAPWGTGGDIQTDGTHLYFANSNSDVIRKISIATGAGTTLAGWAHEPGHVDGVGTQARLTLGWGTGLAKSGGFLYVSEPGQHLIKRVEISTGEVVTFAGSPPGLPASFGSSDGSGAEAKFRRPVGIAIDSTAVYIADTGNNTIRKLIKATGAVSTLAGSPLQSGSADGTGSAARFHLYGGHGGLAVHGTKLFVADYHNHTIREVNTITGQVTTIAGSPGQQGSTNGTGSAARFKNPRGLATDGTSLFVADGNCVIRAIDLSSASVTTLTGTAGSCQHTDGAPGTARLSGPTGLSTDGTNLYFSDSLTVRKAVIASGVVSTLAGHPSTYGNVDAIGSAARFNWVFASAYHAGFVYVTDGGSGRVRKVDVSTQQVTTVGSKYIYLYDYQTAAGQVATDGTDIYVVASPNNVIIKMSQDGSNQLVLAGQVPFSAWDYVDGTRSSARLSTANGMADDGTFLYFNDGNSVIRRVRISTGEVSTLSGDGGWGHNDGSAASSTYNWPFGMVHLNGYLYVTDGGNNVIRRVSTADGSSTTIAGSPGSTGSTDGIGSAARFNFNWGGGITTDGNFLYVADSANNTIRKVEIASGAVTTIAGTAGVAGSSDGIGAAAQFNIDIGGTGAITIDDEHEFLFVQDTGNNTIRKIELATNAVTTLAGSAGSAGADDGAGAAAKFNFAAWAADLKFYKGEVHVLDSGNGTIRKVNPDSGAVTTVLGKAGIHESLNGTLDIARLNGPVCMHISDSGLFIGEQTAVRWVAP